MTVTSDVRDVGPAISDSRLRRPRVMRWIGQLTGAIGAYLRHRHGRKLLSELPDYLLDDIGLTREGTKSAGRRG